MNWVESASYPIAIHAKMLRNLLADTAQSTLPSPLLLNVIESSNGQLHFKNMAKVTRESWVPDVVAESMFREYVDKGEWKKTVMETDYPEVFIAWIRVKKREFLDADASKRQAFIDSFDFSKLPSIDFVMKYLVQHERLRWTEMSFLLRFAVFANHFLKNRNHAGDALFEKLQKRTIFAWNPEATHNDDVVAMTLGHEFIRKRLDLSKLPKTCLDAFLNAQDISRVYDPQIVLEWLMRVYSWLLSDYKESSGDIDNGLKRLQTMLKQHNNDVEAMLQFMKRLGLKMEQTFATTPNRRSSKQVSFAKDLLGILVRESNVFRNNVLFSESKSGFLDDTIGTALIIESIRCQKQNRVGVDEKATATKNSKKNDGYQHLDQVLKWIRRRVATTISSFTSHNKTIVNVLHPQRKMSH